MSYNRRIIAITLLLTSLACSKSSDMLTSDGKTLCEKMFENDLGKIYIGDSDYLSSIENVGEKDVLVLDQRDTNDPNIKIINSYKIKSLAEMNCVLGEISKYENENPSNWNRSRDSMMTEWILHNISYTLNYRRERTKDVDLNNNDEIVYKKVLVRGHKND